ncbi:MAG TPA: signal peptidase [Planctomycetota bacterium]|nr:signal peptidase [Planctomycetota bacterium]
MKKLLLAGGLFVFGSIAATVAVAADHKPARHPAPAHASMFSSPAPVSHKGGAPKKNHGAKRHHGHAHKAHRTK